MPTERRVLLFGSEGFIGGHILQRIRSRFRVVAPLEAEVDIRAPESLRQKVQEGDLVINAAGYADATDRSTSGRKRFREINVEGVRNLAEACSLAGARQFIHISSVAAMGRWTDGPISENMMRTPSSPYAQSKADAERMLQDYMGRLNVTILRPTSVFGEGRGLARSLCAITRRKVVPLPAGGRAKIPFTYVGNVSKCVELTLDNERCFNRAFIIGDEESYRLKDIVCGLASGMETNPVFVNLPRWFAVGIAAGLGLATWIPRLKPPVDRNRLRTLTDSVSYSIKAFQEATGYEPEVSMASATKKIGRWYAAGLKRGLRPRDEEAC